MVFTDFINKEISQGICGDQIGSGKSRKVYECLINPDLVVKIESDRGCFSNVVEWELWINHLEGHEWAHKYFAPCHSISPCGGVLFMTKTEKPRYYPEWVPSYWTDLKLSNYGMIGDQLVCHDYGMSNIEHIGIGEDKPRFRNTRWWDLSDKQIS